VFFVPKTHHESDACPTVCIWYPAEGLLDDPGDDSEKSAVHCSLGTVQENVVAQRLWRADHVFLGCNELGHCVVQLGSLPAVDALLLCCIPIECLGDIVGQVAHVAPPPVPMV